MDFRWQVQVQVQVRSQIFHLGCQQPKDILVVFRLSSAIKGTSKMSQDQAEQNIQMWKVKKLIKSLDSARGFVTLYLSSTVLLIKNNLIALGLR